MIKRLGLIAIGALLCGLPVASATAALGPRPLVKYHYDEPDGFGRDYYVYEPTHRASGFVPLVVYLHGCTQGAQDAAIGTRWTELAEKRGFVAVFPDQDPGADPVDKTVRSAQGSANGAQCWNWFRPEDQQRGAGEPKTIADITKAVIAKERIDPRYVFILGASAGADMSTIMAATYPDIYAAVGSVLGCPFLSCGDVTGAGAFRAMGTNAHQMPAFVVDGTADELNPFPQSQNLVQEWLGTNDLVDDGLLNGSVSRQPVSIEQHDSSVGTPGTGDNCVRPSQWPCLGWVFGFKGSYPYTVFHYDAVDFWLIHGLGHDYPGGDPNGTFTDPLGPDITTAAYDFFMSHPRACKRNGPC